MSVDEATVRRIARLARIAVTDDQLAPLAKELSAILDWCEDLSELDTEGVEPMTSVVETEMKMRDDVITQEVIREAVVSNAPLEDDGFFAVPKVIE